MNLEVFNHPALSMKLYRLTVTESDLEAARGFMPIADDAPISEKLRWLAHLAERVEEGP
jgi:hypothetical protein